MGATDDKVWENRLRRMAKRLGLSLRKSRARETHLNDRGGYMIVSGKMVAAGDRFELDLSDVEDILRDTEDAIVQETKELRGGKR